MSGSRAAGPSGRQSADLVPAATVTARKEAGTLRLGVPRMSWAWLAEKQAEVVLKPQQLANRARAGQAQGRPPGRRQAGGLAGSLDRAQGRGGGQGADPRPHAAGPDLELIAEVDGWTRFSEDFSNT